MNAKQAIVAGYTCLDIIPDLSSYPEGQFQHYFQPRRLLQAKGVTLTPGGVVSNTGLTLHRLGVPVRLIGKIGDDLFGRAVQNLIREDGAQLADDLVIDPSQPTACTIIINPPGYDRAFLHNPGANDTFYASDLPREILQGGDLFHFGYPTVMRSIYRGDGGELVSILQRARRAGLTTALDFTLPDPNSSAGQVDWREILANALPYVDLFLPSLEELIFLLDRDTFDQMCTKINTPMIDAVTPNLLSALAEHVLDFGVKAVLVKFGHRGLYLRTASEERWKKGGRGLDGLDERWHDREIWVPAFITEIRGTTDAGDAAVAGFIASILKEADPGTALKMAAAVGACCVETGRVHSEIGTWEQTKARFTSGWESHPLDLSPYGWHQDQLRGFWEKDNAQ